jgi:DMSO/TMAO reductase YedYZ heme-binding membrane subunit
MTAIDLSCYAGLTAMILLTVNLLLGLLLSTRYNPVKQWPHRKIKIFAIHNWNAYIALTIALLHPLILLTSKTAGFGLMDIVYPVHSPVQPLYNTIGAIALYLLLFVVITSYFRPQLGNRRWKKLHYVAFACAAVFYTHAIFTNPDLKDAPLDPFDGEKILVEGCALLVIAAIVWRVRHGSKRAPMPVPTKAR